MANKSQSELNKELVDKLSIYRKPLPRKVMEEILKNANESTYEYAQPLSTDTPNEINTTPPEIFKSQTYNTNEMKMTDTRNTTNMTDENNKRIQAKRKRVWVEVKSTLVTLAIMVVVAGLIYVIGKYPDTTIMMLVCIISAILLWGIKEFIRVTLFHDECWDEYNERWW